MRIPLRRNGSRAASTHLEKVRGASAYPNGRRVYSYFFPSKAKRRNLLCFGLIGTWKYASFRSMLIPKSFRCTQVSKRFIVSIRKGRLATLSLSTLRSRIGLIPPFFLGTKK